MMRHLFNIITFVAVLLLSFGAKAETQVSEADILTALKEEFLNQGVAEALDVEMFGGQANIMLEQNAAVKIMISGLKYSDEQEKFTAHADIFADGKLIGGTDLIGKFYRLEEISVPNRNINRGEQITAKDLDKKLYRSSKIKETNITDAAKIIGQEAKRQLKKGKLIQTTEIGPKMLIRKGDKLTAVYQTPHMQITAKVEAENDGAKGDRIEVINIKSGKTFTAEVIDSNTVRVDVQ